jgi:AcrR family transcriptional regulator
MESDHPKQRNKELTKRKLIKAVGDIIAEKGYGGLGVNKIAKEATVDKKLIYRYFGNMNGLIEAYILENDYWLSFARQMQESTDIQTPEMAVSLISSILERQFNFFYEHEDMQRIILEEITKKDALLTSISNIREKLGDSLVRLTDPHFERSDVNFRAVGALLVSGIYYLVLHAKTNGSTVSGIDINTPEGRKEIIQAIRQIIQWSFKAAKNKEKDDK